MHASLMLAMALGAAGAEKALEQRISVSFASTPFIECLEELRERTSIAYAVDNREVDAKVLERPVTLELKDARGREVLDLLVEFVDTGYVLDGSVVFLTSYEAAMRKRAVLRLHDVRDLTLVVQDHPGMMFGPPVDVSRIVIATEGSQECVTASSLAEMIQFLVEPDTWAAELGTSIEERGGQLVVMQTPETQEKIAKLLARLAWKYKRTVEVEAVLLRLGEPPEKPLAGLLDDGAARELMRKGEIMFRATSAGFANQRRYVFSAEEVRYVADIKAEKDAYDPHVRTLYDGFSLDVLPVHAEGSRSVTLDLKICWSRLNGFSKKTVGKLRWKGGAGTLNVQEPDVRLKGVQTSICIPLDRWAAIEMAGERGMVVLLRAVLWRDA